MKDVFCFINISKLIYDDTFAALLPEIRWCYLALLFVTRLCKFRPILCIEPGVPYTDQQIAKLLGVSTYSWRIAKEKLIGVGYVKEGAEGALMLTEMRKIMSQSAPERIKADHLVPMAVKPEKAKEIIKTKESTRLLMQKIIDHLNERTGKRFKYFTQESSHFIKGRLNEGATFEDFKICIDNKAKQWNGTEMNIFLRPATLFQASKFWGYVNEIIDGGPKEGDQGRDYKETMSGSNKTLAAQLEKDWLEKLEALKERMRWKTDDDVDWMQVPSKATWVKEQMTEMKKEEK